MKQILKSLKLLVLIVFGIVVTSCGSNDDNDEIIVVVVSEAQAAEVIASSLAYNTYGIASNINYISNEISDVLDCDQQNTNNGTINYTSAFGGVTSSYQFNESYSKSCTSVEMIDYTITALQDIDAVYFTSRYDVSASFNVTGLEDTATHELYSGTYQKEGNWYSKVYLDSLDVLYSMNFTDLSVDKTNDYITSGISTFNLNANYSETTESNSFSGNVIFLNENEAQIDFTNGNSYTLNLQTGEITLL